MQILLDTNILLRLAEPTHKLHETARDSVRKLAQQKHHLLIVPQCLYEFWAVSTRSVEHNGLGKAPSYAHSRIIDYCNMFRLLRDERSIYEEWLELVAKEEVTGVNSYDTRLVAAMVRHGVGQLLTFNAKDFKRYSAIGILDPVLVASGETSLDLPDLNQK